MKYEAVEPASTVVLHPGIRKMVDPKHVNKLIQAHIKAAVFAEFFSFIFLIIKEPANMPPVG